MDNKIGLFTFYPFASPLSLKGVRLHIPFMQAFSSLGCILEVHTSYRQKTFGLLKRVSFPIRPNSQVRPISRGLYIRTFMNQRMKFQNAMKCRKRMHKQAVATWLYMCSMSVSNVRN